MKRRNEREIEGKNERKTERETDGKRREEKGKDEE